ncbi:pyruvate, phosphate dikinase [Desulfovibrio sulfodismutans]|uniref:Pyruvate, phosphate dikinase n=1 Tax=Desulfolutivibrio sulfodismutans TaxID=63561 RepID=A0A7K3NK00_9BACT|nr:PEP-utilizing enzyme [Desulfolutivibrio sulfodismutans]NDY56123.1 pyruvate, phosphate dikinase [Desulfolutivibrio sulfodismutans]QLA13176.1 pyruvate, phosphate dikinase [Desulfolutivibrio sulfodismutans DSM 3696]
MTGTPFLFTSKADTLATLSRHADLNIPPLWVFTVAQWRADPEAIMASLPPLVGESELAVRSSSRAEDQKESSGAGAFTSVLHVLAGDRTAFRDAVETVIASYGEDRSDDQVLVQSMVRGIVASGVIMTRVHTDGSPYYVINYDESGQADAITGGRNASKTVFVFRDAQESHCDSRKLCSFIALARRVESLCGSEALDMEFCLDSAGILHLLQVRPICTQARWIVGGDEQVRDKIGFVVGFVTERMGNWPELYGKRTILGVMPDWNPAEMIGVTPRLLASSLYRELITRRVWSQARELMGYRTMPPEELMLMVAGRPFIDVRVSFNSFLPVGLDTITSEALINAWLDRLDSHPQLHDKVEFQVAQTALDFCFDQNLAEWYPGLLTNSRRETFRSALHTLTLGCLDLGPSSTLPWAYDAVTELRNRQAARAPIPAHGLPREAKPLPQLVLLAEECRLFGTLPFSVLARHAFIAESLLRTAVARGAIAPERVAMFKTSVCTISGEMSCDLMSVCRGGMDRQNFLACYGHLRPSSYDILSPRYADREGLFIDSDVAPIAETAASFTLSTEERAGLEALLQEARLDAIAPEGLLEYARRSIAGRELAKFIFTRNLSDMLELLALWGEGIGLSREELSFLDVRDVMEWASHALLRNASVHFNELVTQGRDLFNLGRSIKLGYIIRSPRDVFIVPQHRSAPNFIGEGKVEAPLVRLYPDTHCSVDIVGCIVCIENADPGFDWIFSRGIAGLITMFGGTNSHMAIRCAEFGLPAAIGIGELLFETVTRASSALLNSGTCVLQPL